MEMATELTRLWRPEPVRRLRTTGSCRHVPHHAPAHLATRPHWWPAAETHSSLLERNVAGSNPVSRSTFFR